MMNELKYNHEIPSYEEKAKVLKENGWETWYDDDNWRKTEWRDQGKKIDMMGRSTESAYKIVNQNKDEGQETNPKNVGCINPMDW